MVQIMKWVVVQPQVFVDFTNNEILLYDTEKSSGFSKILSIFLVILKMTI